MTEERSTVSTDDGRHGVDAAGGEAARAQAVMLGETRPVVIEHLRHIVLVAQRELSGFFYSPTAYVVIAVTMLMSAAFFFQLFEPGEPVDRVMRYTYGRLVQLSIFIIPALSMRLLAEENRSGTIELLLTSPISDVAVVLGKWLGAFAFFAVTLLAAMLPLIVLVSAVSEAGWGQIGTGLLGLMLVAGFYLAIGMCATVLTENQIVAWVIGVLTIGVFTFLMDYLVTASWLSNETRALFEYLNVNLQALDFTKGVISLGSLAYFVIGTGFFLLVAHQLLESRRWR